MSNTCSENNANVILNMRQYKCLIDMHPVRESPSDYAHPRLAYEGLIFYPC